MPEMVGVRPSVEEEEETRDSFARRNSDRKYAPEKGREEGEGRRGGKNASPLQEFAVGPSLPNVAPADAPSIVEERREL